MIVSFPMYDRPETRAAWDHLWNGIRQNLAVRRPDLEPKLPKSPSQPENPWTHWENPALLLSQTCGLPFRTRLHKNLTLVGTPDFGHPDCPPGHYNSAVIQRQDALPAHPDEWPGLTFAVNMFDSQSGWAAPQNLLAEKGLKITRVIASGSHRASAQAVANGRADIAALDAQTWRMIERWDPFAEALQVTQRTPPTPALPLVTALPELADDLADSVSGAIAGLSPSDRQSTNLKSLTRIPVEAYLSVPTPPPL